MHGAVARRQNNASMKTVAYRITEKAKVSCVLGTNGSAGLHFNSHDPTIASFQDQIRFMTIAIAVVEVGGYGYARHLRLAGMGFFYKYGVGATRINASR